MSRIGKKPIELPVSVRVAIAGGRVTVTGPKGELQREIHPLCSVAQEGNALVVLPKENGAKEPSKTARALWGLSRTLIANMVQGVTEGFAKKLEIEGIGYKAIPDGDALALHVGFSNPVRLKIPAEVRVVVEKNVITVSGIDKEKVGAYAAAIKAVKKTEPYKGKGIKYQGEVVRRKLGKKAAGAAK